MSLRRDLNGKHGVAAEAQSRAADLITDRFEGLEVRAPDVRADMNFGRMKKPSASKYG